MVCQGISFLFGCVCLSPILLCQWFTISWAPVTGINFHLYRIYAFIAEKQHVVFGEHFVPHCIAHIAFKSTTPPHLYSAVCVCVWARCLSFSCTSVRMVDMNRRGSTVLFAKRAPNGRTKRILQVIFTTNHYATLGCAYNKT